MNPFLTVKHTPMAFAVFKLSIAKHKLNLKLIENSGLIFKCVIKGSLSIITVPNYSYLTRPNTWLPSSATFLFIFRSTLVLLISLSSVFVLSFANWRQQAGIELWDLFIFAAERLKSEKCCSKLYLQMSWSSHSSRTTSLPFLLGPSKQKRHVIEFLLLAINPKFYLVMKEGIIVLLMHQIIEITWGNTIIWLLLRFT